MKILIRFLLFLTALSGLGNASFANHQKIHSRFIEKELSKLESSSGGRLGVFALICFLREN